MDESGNGLDKDHLVIGGLVVLGDDALARLADAWCRWTMSKGLPNRSKGRKWRPEDLARLPEFFIAERLIPISAWAPMSPSKRLLVEEKMRRLADARAEDGILLPPGDEPKPSGYACMMAMLPVLLRALIQVGAGHAHRAEGVCLHMDGGPFNPFEIKLLANNIPVRFAEQIEIIKTDILSHGTPEQRRYGKRIAQSGLRFDSPPTIDFTFRGLPLDVVDKSTTLAMRALSGDESCASAIEELATAFPCRLWPSGYVEVLTPADKVIDHVIGHGW